MALRPESPGTPDNRKSAQDDVFLREVDEAVRQDQMADFAKRYGIPLLVALALGLAGFGAWLWWQNKHEQQLEQHSEQLIRAFDQVSAGNLDTAYKALDPVIEDEGSPGALAAAKVLRAGTAVEQGRAEEAARLFAEVAGDKNLPQPYRDLAAIREVAVQFDTIPPAEVVERLKPLAVPGNPWFGSAGELVGIAYLKQNKPDLAGPLFSAIAQDESVPESLRARSRQISGLLGVDAIADVDEIVDAQNGAGPITQ